MSIIIRQARRADVPKIIALFVEDEADAILEAVNIDAYEAAFDAMEAERETMLIVGEMNARVVASYQVSFLSGLADHGARRALVSALQIAPDLEGQGLEERMLEDARSRARAARCRLFDLVGAEGADYDALGFTPSGTIYRQRLD